MAEQRYLALQSQLLRSVMAGSSPFFKTLNGVNKVKKGAQLKA
jgi:hypothetical protein